MNGGLPSRRSSHSSPPALADGGRIRRARVEGEHRGGPRQRLDPEQAAAHVVDVVGVAVVRGADRDDRLQRRRPAGGDLERVEAAPGDPEHARRARAPGLGGEPGEHLDGVVLLLGQVLVEEDAVGVAAAAQVDPHRGVAVPGEVGVAGRVADGRAVAPAVGDVLEQRRHRVALRVLGQPDLRRQPAAVGHGDPDGVDDPHRARQVGRRLHERLLTRGRVARRASGLS